MWRAGDGPSLLEKDGCGPPAVGGDPRMASSWAVRAGRREGGAQGRSGAAVALAPHVQAWLLFESVQFPLAPVETNSTYVSKACFLARILSGSKWGGQRTTAFATGWD